MKIYTFFFIIMITFSLDAMKKHPVLNGYVEWDNYYHCLRCKMKAKDQNRIERHVEGEHLRLRRFACQYCHKPTAHLKRHSQKKHPGQKVKAIQLCNSEIVPNISKNDFDMTDVQAIFELFYLMIGTKKNNQNGDV